MTLKARVTVDVWVYFRDICSIPLLFVSADTLISSWLSYYGSEVCLKIRYCNICFFSTFAQDCFGWFGLLCFSVILLCFIVSGNVLVGNPHEATVTYGFRHDYPESSLLREFRASLCVHLGTGTYSVIFQDCNVSILESVRKEITFTARVTLHQSQWSRSPARFQWERSEVAPRWWKRWGLHCWQADKDTLLQTPLQSQIGQNSPGTRIVTELSLCLWGRIEKGKYRQLKFLWEAYLGGKWILKFSVLPFCRSI